MTEAAVRKSSKPFSIGFIGLGTMGYPMAGHLANAGHSVRIYELREDRALSWANAFAGEVVKSPADAAKDADIVITCLRNDDDIIAAAHGDDGIFSTIRPGAIFIDHTTASASGARKMNEHALSSGVRFLDAPLSGGQFGAEKGTLTILVGSEEPDFNDAKPVMQTYGNKIFHMGPVGLGQVTKMVNQILIAGIFQSLSEGLNFAIHSGLDMDHAIKVLSQCTGHSWQMDHRAENMVAGKFDYGFAVDLIHKDLQLCLGESANNGAKLPITELISRNYEELIKQDMGALDATSLIKLL